MAVGRSTKSGSSRGASYYAYISARRERLRARNKQFISAQQSLASVFNTVQLTLSDGLSQIATKRRIALVEAELQAKIAETAKAASSTGSGTTLDISV